MTTCTLSPDGPAAPPVAPPQPVPEAPTYAPLRDMQRPGYKAMWIGICLECLEFTVFFAVYFTARWHYPQAFQEGPTRLSTLSGLCITLVMVSSGFMLTRMVHHLEAGRRQCAIVWMAAALAAGLVYSVLKIFEW